jgi:hypothetical protein
MRDILVIFAAAVALVIVIAAIVVLPVYSMSRASCKAQSERLGLEWTYALSEGCFVKTEGEWLPLGTHLARKVEQNVRITK